MPLYAFRCDTCGPFEERRRIDESDAPARCPRCHGGARRVLTPPNLVRTSPAHRKALSLEEQSAHEPRVVTRPEGGFPGRPLHANHPHGAHH